MKTLKKHFLTFGLSAAASVFTFGGLVATYGFSVRDQSNMAWGLGFMVASVVLFSLVYWIDEKING